MLKAVKVEFRVLLIVLALGCVNQALAINCLWYLVLARSRPLISSQFTSELPEKILANVRAQARWISRPLSDTNVLEDPILQDLPLQLKAWIDYELATGIPRSWEMLHPKWRGRLKEIRSELSRSQRRRQMSLEEFISFHTGVAAAVTEPTSAHGQMLPTAHEVEIRIAFRNGLFVLPYMAPLPLKRRLFIRMLLRGIAPAQLPFDTQPGDVGPVPPGVFTGHDIIHLSVSVRMGIEQATDRSERRNQPVGRFVAIEEELTRRKKFSDALFEKLDLQPVAVQEQVEAVLLDLTNDWMFAGDFRNMLTRDFFKVGSQAIAGPACVRTNVATRVGSNEREMATAFDWLENNVHQIAELAGFN
jgi:hypothetical protein